MSSKPTACWDTDHDARALRVQHAPGRSLLLPYEHFVFAEHDSGEAEDTMRLHFATHKVTIYGHCLHKVETALRRRELSRLGTIPERLAQAAGDGVPAIKSIEVEEIGDETGWPKERAEDL
jgi:hypothetical protein